ncbi:MAG TPA: glycosyltransferase [Bacteroidia bacterium]|nr:glycosyltransferase [Bacteroidia bacterium]HNS11365.1 glycosyltransferase [Bacteroidia bacterium]
MEIKNSANLILFIVLSATALMQLGLYWINFRRLAFYKKKTKNEKPQAVSVIICAKNEAINLQKNLVSILEQDYSDYEVIVVNDCSWDESGAFLEETAKKYPHLKVVTIVEQEKYRHGKKFALTLGIKAAKNEILLMTDADCFAESKHWCLLMQSHFVPETEIVLGYGAYTKSKGFLNKLIRFDTFYIAMNFLSCALGGAPYMGVGRNLAYRRSLFFKNKGFAKHNHLFSGDDDLFVNAAATAKNTVIEIDPDSFTSSYPKMSYSEWRTQKIRHMSTAAQYKFGDKFQLFIMPFSGLLFYGLLVTLAILQFDWRILLSLYGAVLLLKLPILWRNAARLREKDLFWTFPILEPVHLILQPLFYISNLFTKQKAWK